MIEGFKPLLAAPVDFSKLDYNNLWVSPKLDGIRAIVIDGVVMSRSLKPIPNKHVQLLFGRDSLEGYDGELIFGEPTAPDVYRQTNSAVMSIEGVPNITFHVFDHIQEPLIDYHKRYSKLSNCHPQPITVVKQALIRYPEDLDQLEADCLAEGYEGVMLRKFQGPDSYYKFGRSTAKAGTLLKLKRFETNEAEVIGFDEEMRNDNEAVVDALGHTKRSSHQANKVGKGRLGALVCRTPAGVEFRIGTGFDAAQREEIWANRDKYLGQLANYKSLAIGVKDAPRHPVFRDFRSRIDL